MGFKALALIYSAPLYFDWIVQAFNYKYPNVKVTYNFGFNENDNKLWAIH